MNFRAEISPKLVFIFQESCYQPQVEAISPTGPEAPGDQMDDLKVLKDDLLSKITKVDREIAKTESQIAKLKKKYQEQEEHANKPLSDTNEDEEKPKNQSIAQIIYAENRVRIRIFSACTVNSDK